MAGGRVPGELGGNGGLVLASTLVLVGVAGEAVSSLLCGHSDGFLEWVDVGGIGEAALSSKDGVGGRWAMSPRMGLHLGGWYMGMNLLRNCLFLSVSLPDPLILMKYWWNWCTSTTIPVRSHLLG